MARSKNKVYDIPLKCGIKIVGDDAEKTKDMVVTSKLKFINNTSYDKLIIVQEDTVCLQIVDE